MSHWVTRHCPPSKKYRELQGSWSFFFIYFSVFNFISITDVINILITPRTVKYPQYTTQFSWSSKNIYLFIPIHSCVFGYIQTSMPGFTCSCVLPPPPWEILANIYSTQLSYWWINKVISPMSNLETWWIYWCLQECGWGVHCRNMAVLKAWPNLCKLLMKAASLELSEPLAFGWVDQMASCRELSGWDALLPSSS